MIPNKKYLPKYTALRRLQSMLRSFLSKYKYTAICIVALSCAIAIRSRVFSSLSHHSKEAATASSAATMDPVSRVYEYCNRAPSLGDEGNALTADHKDMELLSLIIAIRHGDRSAIHSFPGAVSHSIAVDNANALLEKQAREYTVRLTSFNLSLIEREGELVANVGVLFLEKRKILNCFDRICVHSFYLG
jgi:hypothetical protein